MNELLLGVLTIAMSGVAAAVATFTLNDRRDRRFFLRSKAEALVTSIEVYSRALASHFLIYYPVLRREISYDQAHDLMIAGGKESDGRMSEHSNAMLMLIAIYFPGVEPAWKTADATRATLYQIIMKDKRAYRAGAAGNLTQEFDAAFSQLNSALDNLKASAIDTARRICRDERLVTANNAKAQFTHKRRQSEDMPGVGAS